MSGSTRRLWGALLVAALLSGGCWNRREPEMLSNITAVGFDYDVQTREHIVTVQIARPAQLAAGPDGGGGGEEEPFYAATGRGATPYEALRLLEQDTVRELYWADTRAVLVSEELAREVGLRSVLDLLQRERQFRLTAFLFVVEGSSQAVLSQEHTYRELAGTALSRQLTGVAHNLSMAPLGNLRENLIELSRPGLEMLLPRIEIQTAEPPTRPNPSRLMGAAVFRNDQMRGWLDGPATRGWHLTIGTFSRSTVVSEIGDDLVSVELLRHRSNTSLSWQGDEPYISVEAQVMGRIQSQTGKTPFALPSPTMQKLEEDIGRQLQDDMSSALSMAQSWGADIFGFGELIYRKYPQQWLLLEKQWAEKGFPQLDVEFRISVHIERTGLIVKPMREGQ